MKRKDTGEEIIVLGKIPKRVETETKGLIPSSDICMYEDHLYKHIESGHSEIKELDTDAVSYVDYVINNFFEIRKGSGNSFILIAKPKFLHRRNGNMQRSKNAAYIQLQRNQVLENGSLYTFWEVKSVHPRRDKNIKSEIVWKYSE